MRREFHVRFCEGGGVKLPSATRLAEVGKPEGLTAVEYLCAFQLRHPPPAVTAAIRSAPPGMNPVRMASLSMKYDPENRFHRAKRAAWAYYGVDHHALCEGMEP